MSEEDLPFWVGQRFGELEGWRALIRPPQSRVGEVANAVAATGRTVVAAAGNARGYAFTPALEPAVFSASFIRERRELVDSLREDAVAARPTFSQSEFSDFSVIQPPHVLGSSFATPLISGFAALMRSRSDLAAYRDMERLAGLAAQLYVRLDSSAGKQWSDRRDGVVNALFVNAVNSQPHPHLNPDHYEVCPDCAYFAANAYINFGLMKLEWGDLAGAEQLLRPAEAFAPTNPHAAANLGMVYAQRAKREQRDQRWSEVSALLTEAARLQQKASVLRPDHEPYRARVAEFVAGAKDPQLWTMAP